MKHAAHHDLTLELGVDFVFTFAFIAPVAAPVDISTLTSDHWLSYPGPLDREMIWPIQKVTNAANGKTTVELGRGLFTDPKFTLDSTLQALPLEAKPIHHFNVAVSLPGDVVHIGTLNEFVTIAPDALSATIMIPASDPFHEEIALAVDWIGMGPNGTLLPYSIGVETTDGIVRRILEGSLMLIRTEMQPQTQNPFPQVLQGVTP